MRNLQSLFIRADGLVTANPTGEQFRLDDLENPLAYFRERLDARLSHYAHIACDVTDNCNLRCPFCINDFSNASSTKMNERHFARLVEMAPLADDEAVFVSCLCEPLLHPRLLDLLRLIPAALRDKFFLTTNLTVRRMPRSFFAELATMALHHVNVSLDSLHKDTFEHMRVNAKHQVFLDNLALISEVFSTTPGAPQLRAITVAARANVEQIPSLIETANERYRVNFYELRYPFEDGTPMGPWRDRNLLGDDEWDALVERVSAMPYRTHVSRGNSLLLCGFGQAKPAQSQWGPSPAVEDDPPVPWHLPLQLALAPARSRLHWFVATRFPAWLPAVPAVVASSATASADGTAHLSGSPGHAAVGIAALNVGRDGPVTAVPVVSGAPGLSVTICATDPETGRCRATPGRSVTATIAAHSTETFSVFVTRRASAAPLDAGAAIRVVFLSSRWLCGVLTVGVAEAPPRRQKAAASELAPS